MATHMPPSPFGSFLSGTDWAQQGHKLALTRQELLDQKRKENLLKFQEQMADTAASLPGWQQPTFKVFHQLGAMLGPKLGGADLRKPTLTPEEERQVSTLEKAQASIKELQDSDRWSEMDPFEQGYAVKKAVADAQFESGDVPGYIATITAAHKERMANRESALRVKGLERVDALEEAKTPHALEAAAADYARFRKGQPSMFVKSGDLDIESPVLLHRQADGRVLDQEGNEVDMTEYVGLEDALAITNAMTSRMNAQGTTTAPTVGDLAKQIGTSAVSKEAQMLREVDMTARTIERISGVLADAENPELAVGMQGSLISGAADIVKLVTGTGKAAQMVFGGVDEEGKGVGKGVNPFSDDYVDKYIPDSWLPEELNERKYGVLGGLSDEAKRYKAAMMQLVFANARIQEPGGRQLSDQDIERSAAMLGGDSGDPRTMLTILAENAIDNLDSTRGVFERRAGQAAAYNLDPSSTLSRLYGTTGEEKLGPLEYIDSVKERTLAAIGRGREAAGGTVPSTKEQVSGAPAKGVLSKEEKEAADAAGIGYLFD